jgi:hypothetical protein
MDKFIIREDVTTNKRRSTEVPAIEIHYTALAGYYRILRMKGDTRPRHEVKKKAVLAIVRDKFHAKLVKYNTEIAMLNFHSLRPKTEIDLT